MIPQNEERSVGLTFSITVYVDPADVELLAKLNELNGSSSITDVVRNEIASNLESVSYVRHVSIT